MRYSLDCAAHGSLFPKKRDVRERAEKEEEERAQPPDSTGIEKHFAECHHDDEHGYERTYAQEVQAPCRIESEEFQVSRLKVKQEVVTNPVAGEMRILRWKIVSYGKALNQGSVRPEITVLGVSDQEFTVLDIERGKHHPRYEDDVSGYE